MHSCLRNWPFGCLSTSVFRPWRCDLGLRDAEDRKIFMAARSAGFVLISKDMDFVDLVQRWGTPPQLLWVTCGNVTNRRLRQVFEATFEKALHALREGSEVVEIADAP